MGNTGSGQLSPEDQDPWWNPPQRTANTVEDLDGGERFSDTGQAEDIKNCEEWMKREQELGNTIQHLAKENMRLSTDKKELESKIKQMFDLREEELTKCQCGKQNQNKSDSSNENVSSNDFIQKDEEKIGLLLRIEALEQMLESTEKFKDSSQKSDTGPEAVSEVSCSSAQEQLLNTEKSSEVSRNKEEMARFKEDLCRKREARHRALRIISEEMERLRSELRAEKITNQELKESLEKSNSEGKDDEQVSRMSDELKTEKLEKQRLAEELDEIKLGMKMSAEKIETYELKIKSLKEDNSIIKDELNAVLKRKEKYELDAETYKNESIQIQKKLEEKLGEIGEIEENIKFERERKDKQITALKDVASISKQLLRIREDQVTHMKNKLKELEGSISKQSETCDDGNHDSLKKEYSSQIESIKQLKELYEERMKLVTTQKEKLEKELQNSISQLSVETSKAAELESRLEEVEDLLSKQESSLEDKQFELEESLSEGKKLSQELNLINNIFTQILLGSSGEVDIDKLTRLLQENHDLITELTTKDDGNDSAVTLSKLLLDVVNQVQDSDCNQNSDFGSNVLQVGDANCENYTVQKIASNLPKVWKVLMELLSHHDTPSPPGEICSDDQCCYKSVETPYGPRLVISVSKTFLRIKDLILEKKTLLKELNNLKCLNGHLESKLVEQERRLSLVSTELHKTWSIVDRMRAQHQQLHTHEKILRYELQEKRIMLTELKQELEYCREKWECARKKNSESETEWKKLRKEFAERKNQNTESNASEESGFSDEKGDSGDEENSSGKEDLKNANTFQAEDSLPHNCSSDEDENNSNETPFCSSADPSSRNVESLDLQEPPPHLEIISENKTADSEVSTDSIDTETQNINDPNETTCSTISLIALLKQELSNFSSNLDKLTTDMKYMEAAALNSIFSLPPIEIPHTHKDLIHKQRVKLKRTNSNQLKQRPNELNSSQNERKEHTIIKLSDIIPEPEVCSSEGSEQSNKDEAKLVDDEDSCSASEMTMNEKDNKMKLFDQLKNQEISNSEADKIQTEENKSPPTPPPMPSSLVSNFGVSSPSIKESSEDGAVKSERSLEEVLDARAERLKRLEEQSQKLFNKVSRTTIRSCKISDKLEQLHEQYGPDEKNLDRIKSKRSSLHCTENKEKKESPDLLNSPQAATNDELQQNGRKKEEESCAENKDDRLKKMEIQCQNLFQKVTGTPIKEGLIVLPLPPEASGSGNNAESVDERLNIPNPPPLPNGNCSSVTAGKTFCSKGGSLEEMLDKRAARLRRLEEQSRQLMQKVTKTTRKSVILSNRLEGLHEQYGEPDGASASTSATATNYDKKRENSSPSSSDQTDEQVQEVSSTNSDTSSTNEKEFLPDSTD